MRWFLQRKVVIPILLVMILFILYSEMAKAEPVAKAVAGGTTIILFDEPCVVDAISNLKYRATWTEGGKTFEGCFGQHPQYPVLMFYFSDKTVTILPVQAFGPVVSG